MVIWLSVFYNKVHESRPDDKSICGHRISNKVEKAVLPRNYYIPSTFETKPVRFITPSELKHYDVREVLSLILKYEEMLLRAKGSVQIIPDT